MTRSTHFFSRGSPGRMYALAVSLTAVTLALRLAAAGVLGHSPALVLFTLPVALSAYLGGRGPGLLATIISAALANLFPNAGGGERLLPASADLAQWLIFLAAGVLISLLCGRGQGERPGGQGTAEARKSHSETHERLAAIIASSQDAIIGKTLSGVIESWNPGAERMFGYTAAEAIGRPLLMLFPPERRDEEARILSRIARGETVPAFDTVRVRKDGKRLDISVTISPIHDEQGRVIGASKIARDVTGRRRAEAELRLAEERFHSTLDHLLEAGQLLNFDWVYLYLNPAAERQNRRPNAELLGRSMLEAWPGIDQTEVFGLFRRAMTERVATFGEVDFHFPDGHHGWFEVRTHPVPEGIFILSVEVTDRRRAERTNTELAQIVQSMSEACFALDHDWRFTFANRQVEKLLRHTRQELLGRTIWEVFVTLVGTAAEASYRRAMTERVPVSFEAWSPIAGRWLDTRLFPTGTGLAAFLLDIQTRKEAEGSLRETEERFRQVVENIEEVFRMTEAPQGKVLYVSPGYERIWGRACASLYAAGERWPSAVVAEDRERVEAAIGHSAGAEWDLTYRIARPDGSIRWIRDRAFPVKAEQAKVQRMVGIAEDITEAKKMEQQFLRAQRLEAIGTLSSGIAHDLNNILAPMLMLMPALQPKLSDPRDVELLQLVEQSAQRGANIIRQLLTFSRGVEGERGPVQLRTLLREVLGILRETLPRNIVIEEEVPPDVWQINADATQLHQVLLNLCVNARDAMPVGGRLRVEVQNIELLRIDLDIHPQARPGRYVVLIVADTGVGIPAHLRDRIFEPFFTTKPLGKGTGLGLSTVLGIVKSHGGFVNVYSEPPRGCVFRVYLPADAQPRAGERKDAIHPPTGNQELLLLVEDEIAVRQSVAQALEKSGYRVLTAASGQEAIRVFLEHQTGIRLVVTDLMMPDMDGFGLIRSLRALHVGLPVIAASGLQDRTRSDELAALGVNLVLTKPFAIGELLRAIGERLKPSA